MIHSDEERVDSGSWAWAGVARLGSPSLRFFVQAEDGIRDLTVTGVQTCALPIFQAPVKGAGQPNPLCGQDQPRPEDKTENARSTGTLITFGKFRLIDLGDLTWNKEQDQIGRASCRERV